MNFLNLKFDSFMLLAVDAVRFLRSVDICRLLAISLSALLTFSLPSLAYSAGVSGSVKSQLKLHKFQLAAQKSLCGFYMYNYMEGDPRYARIIEESLQGGSALLLQITEISSDGSKTGLEKLDQQWGSYKNELNSLADTLKTQGFVDVQRAIDLVSQNEKLMELSAKLYDNFYRERGSNVTPMTQLSREQSMLIQSIAINYAARNAWVDGMVLASNGDGDKSINKLASDFASGLHKLEQEPHNTAEIRQLLNSIRIKWRYIEKSLKNYNNEKNIPMAVNNIAFSISNKLESVSTQYSEKNL